jgi:hypothetical protein
MAEVHVGNGGLIRYTSDNGTVAYLLFSPTPQGRLALTEFFVPSEDDMTAEDLRSIRLSRIKAWANSPDNRELILDKINDPRPDLHTAAAHFNTTFGKADHWVAEMLAASIGKAPQPSLPEEITPSRHRRRWQARLKVPTERPYPDNFYRRVAELYSYLATTCDRPAAEIAVANNVPVTTVHRWVKESRRRGFLAPGRRGRAG